MDFAFDAALRAAGTHQPFVVAVFLLSIRLSAIFVLTPLLQAFEVPVVARVLFVVGLAVALALGLDASLLPQLAAMTAGSLVVAMCTEAALGATLALGVLSAFAAISMAGRLVDVQIGFGIAQVFDPVTRRQVPIVNAAFDKLGVILFFLVNGHHALLRGIAYSLERFPVGRTWPLAASAPIVIKEAAGLFALGLALAAPVVVCLLMVELALGVVARNLPQINMFVIGVPLKIVVGVAALALWLGGVGDAMGRVYGSIYRSWDATFAAAASQAGR
jgi:flagellar biosynthetic protein FliR